MTRDRLLDAAEALLVEQGTSAFTLAAVAQRAGTSKGGLLYYFSSKEALVRALVERLIDEFDQAIASHDDLSGPGSYSRAYVNAVFDVLCGAPVAASRRWAVVTAAATDADILDPLRGAFRRWHTHPDDVDEVTGHLVRAAAEGVWEVCHMAPGTYESSQLVRMRQRLLDVMTGCSGASIAPDSQVAAAVSGPSVAAPVPDPV